MPISGQMHMHTQQSAVRKQRGSCCSMGHQTPQAAGRISLACV